MARRDAEWEALFEAVSALGERLGLQIARRLCVPVKERRVSSRPRQRRSGFRDWRPPFAIQPAPPAEPEVEAVPEEVPAQFAPGAVVLFDEAGRAREGSILAVDSDKGEVVVLTLGTSRVQRRRPGELRLAPTTDSGRPDS
jgi:hypothetical protein